MEDEISITSLQERISALLSLNEGLAREVAHLKGDRKLGLVWEDNPDAQVLRLLNNVPLLCEDRSKAVVTDEKAANHVLINGDNYHALTALLPTHTGKIDVIYIDPPYNTGHKDFIYNDSYLDKEDTYRHSKWLSFMHQRLILAQKLLADTGAIFVSIDDNEHARLRLLLDEVFSPENFISDLIINSNPRGSQYNKHVAVTHEYVLLYAKKKSSLILGGHEKQEHTLNEYKLSDENGPYRLIGLRQRGLSWRRSDRPKMFYPLYIDPMSGKVSLTKDEAFSIEVIPARPTGEESRWTWSQEKVKQSNDLLVGRPVRRAGQSDAYDVFRKDYLFKEGKQSLSKPRSIWDEKEINYQNGRDELNAVLPQGMFDYPKPLHLIEQILRLHPKKNAVVLDFFAGSGTTAHAVAKLNKEDNGSRQCILVTDGGKAETIGESSLYSGDGHSLNIAEQVTYERVRRVLTGKGWADGKTHEPLGGNLRYFKVELIPITDDSDNTMISDKLPTNYENGEGNE